MFSRLDDDIPRSHRNNGCSYREQLGPLADGQRLLDYLSRQYPHSTRTEWEENITAGLVLLNDRPAAADEVLRSGSWLVWQRPPWTEPPAPRCWQLLYEDAELLAVAKPAGLPTLPGAGFHESTLLHLVQQYSPDAVPLHRLGRWTSGLVLCAKTTAARRALLQQWSGRTVFKRYRALITGSPVWSESEISTPIGPVPHPLLGTVYAASSAGKKSRSLATVLERRGDTCLCDVVISTGRPHQIRIHLASVGHPLAGDPLYGSDGLPQTDSTALPGDPGYQLHATELRVRHPVGGAELQLCCPPPLLLRTASEIAVVQETVALSPEYR